MESKSNAMDLIYGSDTCRIWKGSFGKVYAEVTSPHPSGDPGLVSWVPWALPTGSVSWMLSRHLGLSDHPEKPSDRELYVVPMGKALYSERWGTKESSLPYYWVYMRYAVPSGWVSNLDWANAWAEVRWDSPWGWCVNPRENATEEVWKALILFIAEGGNPFKEAQGKYIEVNTSYRSSFPRAVVAEDPTAAPLTVITLLNHIQGK